MSTKLREEEEITTEDTELHRGCCPKALLLPLCNSAFSVVKFLKSPRITRINADWLCVFKYNIRVIRGRFFLNLFTLGRKHFKTSLQYAVYAGNGYTVVGEGDILFLGLLTAEVHLALVEHTGAAVDYYFVRRKISGEIAAGSERKIYIGLCIVPYHAGDFYRAYIIALAVVRAAFAYQNFIAVLQAVKRRGAAD